MAFSLKRLSLLTSLLALLSTGEAAPRIEARAKAATTDYDVIIVGAGVGGLVSAAKFAEAGLNTLLLERGGPMLYRDGNREIPEWSLEEYPGNNITRHDAMCYYPYNYPTTGGAAYYCPGLPEGSIAACELGGGTSVNAEQQFWPPKRYLESAFGFEGWTVDDFQPALDRVVERLPVVPTWSADGKFYYDQVYGFMASIMETINMTEVNTTSDGNDKYNNFGRDVYSTANGLRGGPLIGYLQPAKALPNFTLKLYSKVEYVVRNGTTISGVYVNGTTITAPTVILAGGVLLTPTLLFASGIGPRSVLETAASIGYTPYTNESDWIINEAVGTNVHDNPTFNVNITYDDANALPYFSTAEMIATGGGVSKEDKDMLFYNHTGPLTMVGRQLVGWITVDGTDETVSMTIQTICSTPTAINGSFICQFNLNEGTLSRGRLILSAEGNLTFADGVGPWLTDSRDVKSYALALQRFIDGVNNYPGANVTYPSVGSLEDYEAFLSQYANQSNNHWGGSCTIGTSDGTQNGTDCVDINAKVYGTDNLYIIDGSLSPKPTTSNPAFLYEGIAEIAVERILTILGVSS